MLSVFNWWDAFCHFNPILITNAKTQARKGLILYSNANGNIALKKHVFVNHSMIAKKFEEELNRVWPQSNGPTMTKNSRTLVLFVVIFTFPYKGLDEIFCNMLN